MRSSAKYRPTETSYISADDHFAALQIDFASEGGAGCFGGICRLCFPRQFSNYRLLLQSRNPSSLKERHQLYSFAISKARRNHSHGVRPCFAHTVLAQFF